MAIIPSDEKVFMVDKRTNTIYGGSAALQAMQQWYTMQDVSDSIRPYKVFTALLTQSGSGSTESFIDSGDLSIGTTYYISANDDLLADFTNVGAPNNEIGTYFIATGTTPNSWGTFSELGYVASAPVATVLENTIGNVWFTYGDVGLYSVKSDELFINNKTICSLSSSLFGGSADFNSNLIFYSSVAANNEIFIISSSGGTYSNDQLSNTPIEIRVYN